MRKLWGGGFIRLDFGPDEHGRKLTLTFSFMSGLVRVLTILTALWALAAGFLQSGRLIEHLPDLFPVNPPAGFWARNLDWLAPLLGTPVYAISAFSLCMLIGLAAASAGALLGFLFGVPRPISDLGASTAVAPTATSTSTDANATQASPQSTRTTGTLPGPGWQASTNLTQVSDWLTKIIVGVGLVEATTIYQRLSALSVSIGGMLFDGMLGTRLVIPSLMVAGAIIGFLYAYLFTQLFLAALMAYSAQKVASPFVGFAEAIATMSSFSAANPTVADPITRGGGTEPIPKSSEPTHAQRMAADNLQTLSLDIIDDPGTILAWARAAALRRDYREAARGFRKLLLFVSTPDVLAEAARVLNANGEASEAKALLDSAVAGRASVSPDVGSRIAFDSANLALYDPPPAGYTRALELLRNETLSYDPKGELHILRACANAQKYRYEGDRLSATESQKLRQEILEDLRRGLSLNPDNIAWVRYLWDPSALGKTPPGTPDRDDDLEIFHGDDEFRSLIAP